MWGATTQNSRSVQSQSISIHAPRVGRDNIAEHTRKINQRFQSTRPVWGATQAKYPQSQFYQISIHAPRVGRDVRRSRSNQRLTNFNPRAPCGARLPSITLVLYMAAFQSTRPVWGATRCRAGHVVHGLHFNPRAPCGARRLNAISSTFPSGFQSTRPVWGATANLTILPRQICTKGTKEFLLGRKTHGKKEK